VDVRRVGDARLSVEIHAWAQQASRPAADHLEASVLALSVEETRKAEARAV
jgi:hypothetical protein